MNWLFDSAEEGVSLIYKGWSMRAVCVVLLGALAVLGLMWVLQQGSANRWLRGATMAMRLSVVALLAMALMDPVIRSQELIPQQSYLAHLFDISESMGIADMKGKSRIDTTKATAMATAEPRAQLDEMYRHVEFAFDTETVAIGSETPLAAGDRATDLEAALRNLKIQIGGLPLSGVVLYSDGNSTIGAAADSTTEAAQALGVPVYTVGTAPKTPGADFWIQEVIHPKEIADYVDTRITALVGSRGMRGETAVVSLYQEGRLLDQKQVVAPTDEQVLAVSFNVRPDTDDYAVYEVNVAEGAGESYPWNNKSEFFMTVSGKDRRILFVEGSPRYEYRFLRAAFSDDERFQVTSLVYLTREGDFYRQGIQDSSELRQGFPETEEELFAYDVVVVGDIQASSFNERQLDVLNEFVRKRGGGLLFLAGRDSFAPDGFGDTVLAKALPFQFYDPRQSFALSRPRTVAPSALGKERSLFGPYDPEVDLEPPWAKLPEMEGLFPLYELKPGGRVLCEVTPGRGQPPLPIVAYHRYGKGVAMACGISATWQWKFLTSAEDPAYQAFWKEMVLALMEGQQDLIQVGASPPLISVGEETTIRGNVLNETFELKRTASVTLEVLSPDGSVQELTPRPTTAEGFTFEQAFTPTAQGVHRLTARSTVESTGAVIEDEAVLLATSESPELAEVNLNESFLRQIATASGGTYVHLSDYGTLHENIAPLDGSLYKTTEHSAWDSKWILIALLGLLLGEWMTRRIGGLA